MTLTLEQAVARLARLVYDSLAGAELKDFRLVEEDAREVAYIVRWKRNDREFGTHRAVLHEDGRGMLVWGHYTRDEAEAKRDYEGR